MSELLARIEAFRRLPVEADSAEKYDALSAIESSDEDVVVVPFFLECARNVHQPDTVRIEALKVLMNRTFADGSERRRAAEVILELVRHETDWDVRNWAVLGLWNFMEEPNVATTVMGILLDREEDSVVRHNAFFALERGGPTPRAIEVLDALGGDEEFASAAERVRKMWT